jgi:integrase
LAESGKCRRYCNYLVQQIRRIFKWGVSQELIPETVYRALATVSGLKRGRTEAREPDPVGPVADTVVDATLPHLPVVIADMVRLERLTGCRPAEVCSIRPCDVDTSGNV